MLTITAALPWEAKAARAGQAIAGRGRVRIITSGVGPQRAREAAEEAVEDYPEYVISIGVAGGLTNNLRRPSITLPTNTIRQTGGAVFPAVELTWRAGMRITRPLFGPRQSESPAGSAGPAPITFKPDEVAVVVAPHPDDETGGAGGAAALHAAAGATVRLVIVTDGGASGASVENTGQPSGASTASSIARSSLPSKYPNTE